MRILDLEGNEIKKIDLGILEAGNSKTYTFVAYNDSYAEVVDLEIKSINNEVEVKNYPKTLSPQEKSNFDIVWSPSVNIKKALETVLKISCKELYRPIS